MTTRAARWVAVLMLGVFVASSSLGLMLAARNESLSVGDVQLLLAFAAFMVVGAVVVARRPDNVLGWLFSAVGLLAATGALAMEYAEYAYVTSPGSLPGAIFAAWYAAWFWFPLIWSALVFPLLLFPTGRPPSPRWTPVLWLAGLSIAGITLLDMLRPVLVQTEDYVVHNPIGVQWVGDMKTHVEILLFGLLLASLVAAFVSLVIRFRGSRGEERQQLKWFTYGGALVVVTHVLPLDDLYPMTGAVGDFILGLPLVVPPIAAGIAILKYRLYDIDLLIRYTLIYGMLLGLLVVLMLALYFGLVVILHRVFASLPSENDQLAIVVSLLAVVALFQPLRRRMQDAVDRRFYRRRYDAQKTLQAFSARLREETNLDTLSDDLVAVVQETLQPTHVSVWLRGQKRET